MLRGKALKNIILVFFGLLSALILVEGIIRVVYKDKFGKRPGFYVMDEELGWKLAPNLDHTFYGPDFEISVNTDADGIRLGALGKIDYNKRLIVLCGDSYIFGWGVSTAETFASHLDELVFNTSGGTTRVVNLGVGGYGTFQYYYRLMRFLIAHKSANIAAFIIVHSQNDAVDNLKSLGYHIGTWEVRNRQSVTRSRFHLVNFMNYVRTVSWHKQKGSQPAASSRSAINDPYLQDVLFSHENTRTNKEYPPNVSFNGHLVSFKNVSDEDWYLEKLLDRKSLTPIQSELMQVGINFIHYMVANRNAKILHVTTPTMSDWYREELVQLLNGSNPSPGNAVILMKQQYPDTTGFTGQIMNTHSGGHYTPSFNKYWAEKMMIILHQQNVL